MTIEEDEDRIVKTYHHLLALDDDDDKEKHWIVEQQPKAAGLSTLHLHILSFLKLNPDVLAKEIGDHLNILRGTLSKRLTLLERRGMISSHADREDARGKRYRLTPLGVAIAATHDDLLAMKNRLLKQRLATFTPEQLMTIQTFLEAFQAAEETDHY